MSICAIGAKTGERRSVLPNASAGHILATGHLIFVRSGSLWAVPFDRDHLAIAGKPVPVVTGVRVLVGGEAQYAVASNGTLVYLPGKDEIGSKKTLVLVNRQGIKEAVHVLVSGDLYDSKAEG